MSSNIFYENLPDNVEFSVVRKIFPSMNERDTKLLVSCVVKLTFVIACCFGLQDDIRFYQKITQNNFMDLKWILIQLLPHINEDIKKMSEITSINDIYIAKTKNQSLNDGEPQYTYSNLQYGRHTRDENDYREIMFTADHLIDNFYLFVQTVKKSCHKLHINWIDIFPMTFDFPRSKMFLRTKKLWDNGMIRDWDDHSFFTKDSIINNPHAIPNLSENEINLMTGLSLEDIYNTISINLYENIRQEKWLIYDIPIEIDYEQQVFPLIIVLNYFFDLDDCVNDIAWEKLIDETKKKYTDSFDKLKKLYSTNTPYRFFFDDNQKVADLPTRSISILVGSLVKFFDRKMKDSTAKYKRLMDRENHQSIMNCLYSLDVKDVYSYIRESMSSFKSTWNSVYTNYTDDNNKKKIGDFKYFCNLWIKHGMNNFSPDFPQKLTLKNIYNFCKSVVGDNQNNEKQKFNRMPLFWCQLSETQKNIIVERLQTYENNDKIDKWFNIKKNLKRTYPNERNIDRLNERFGDRIRGDNILLIIFTCLVHYGILSEFIPNPTLTDHRMYDILNDTQKKSMINFIKNKYLDNYKKKYGKTFYYLTFDTYSNIPKSKIKINNGDEKLMDYFDLLGDYDYAWYTNTSYCWVAQFAFCHRFIHSRVSYITAATGAGKTTQIPKLFCYYTKALDLVSDATICCTVPRTDLLHTTMVFISKELGLPLKIIRDGVEDYSDFYTVQIKFSGESKRVKDGHFPKLIFMTDGSLVADILDPLLKKKFIRDNQSIHQQRNLYDVVIIDEAHEHNANMDMILSIMRTVCYFNNKIRLVILSATIEPDEANYRRFYRSINDNLKYPIDRSLKKYGLDRINIDRRLDIKQPGQSGGKFHVEEYYLPNADAVLTVQDIMTKNPDGDLLLIQSGTSSILQNIQQLNKILPSDVIAIPYYSKMGKNRDFAKNIDSNIRKLKISRNQKFEDSILTEGTSSYRRFVMVSTNIAEASITINSLKFVVDVGEEKNMIFNYLNKTSELRTTRITDASRKQRRGRVGRKSSGSAYFLYPKGAMDNNKKQFNISISDIHFEVIFNYLRNESFPLFVQAVDELVCGKLIVGNNENALSLIIEQYIKMFILIPNKSSDILGNALMFDQLIKGISLDLWNSDKKELEVDNLKKLIHGMDRSNPWANYISPQVFERFIAQSRQLTGILRILIDQYDADKPNNTFYRGNDKMYDYCNDDFSFYHDTYLGGLSMNALIDEWGKYYIVHPDELLLRRNIRGDVVGTSDARAIRLITIKNKIYERQMKSKKMNAFLKMLVDKLYIVDTTNCTGYGGWYRSDTGIFIGELTTKLSEIFPDRTGITDLSRLLGIAILLSDQHMIDRAIKLISIITCQEAEETVKDMMTRYTKIRSSDYDQLLFWLDNLDNMVSRTIPTHIDESHLLHRKYQGKDIQDILVGLPKNSTMTREAIDERSNIIEKLIDEHAHIMANSLPHIITPIIKKYYITREKLTSFYRDFVNRIDGFLKKQSYSLEKLKASYYQQNKFNNIDIDPLTKLLLLAFPSNIYRKIINTSNQYISLNRPNINNIHSVVTTVENIYREEYIIYFTKNLNGDLVLIHPIKKEYLDIVGSYGQNIRKIKKAMNENANEETNKKQKKYFPGRDDFLKALNSFPLTQKKIIEEINPSY